MQRIQCMNYRCRSHLHILRVVVAEYEFKLSYHVTYWNKLPFQLVQKRAYIYDKHQLDQTKEESKKKYYTQLHNIHRCTACHYIKCK